MSSGSEHFVFNPHMYSDLRMSGVENEFSEQVGLPEETSKKDSIYKLGLDTLRKPIMNDSHRDPDRL